jgi:carbon-monoxide dehydrogenase small subunit
MKINITINGAGYEREAPENITLLHFLRECVGLTGTKEGCGGGECGACTVLLDGRAVNACLVLAAEVDGKSVRTIEGEMRDGKPSELQDAFAKRHAVQCGFCTPGVVMSARALIERNPKRRRNQGRPRRQLLPLHWIRADHRSRARSDRATGDRSGA